MQKNIPQINSRVVEVRKSLKMNQKTMAESLGLQQSYYSGVENGRRNVTGRIVEALKVKHDVSADYLYTGKGEPFGTVSTTKSTPENVHPMHLLKKEAIQYDKNGWPFYDANDLTDDEIILNAADSSRQVYLENYTPERAAHITKLVEKQRDRAESAIDFLAMENPDYWQLRKDVKAIRNFDFLYKDVSDSQILRQLTGIGTVAHSTIQTKDIEGIKATLITDLQRFRPYIAAVSRLATAFRAFSDEIEQLSEAETGIDERRIMEFKALSS